MGLARGIWLACCLTVTGCGFGEVDGCDPVDRLQPWCGFQSPEDMAPLADGSVIVSEMGGLEGEPGALSRIIRWGVKQPLYPRDGADRPLRGWGDANCPGAPGAALSPHGIDLGVHPSGATMLLVVNHQREAVELFEWQEGSRQLWWRGCVLFPAKAHLNDVAALPDGGFVVTHMASRGQKSELIKGMLGRPTGFVYRWWNGGRQEVLADSSGALPNGVLADASGETIWVSYYLDSEVRQIDLQRQAVLRRVAIPHPDNLTRLQDGRLLVASQQPALMDLLQCQPGQAKPCAFPYALWALDGDGQATSVWSAQGAPMGGISVGLERPDGWWLGSFAGDRLVRVAQP